LLLRPNRTYDPQEHYRQTRPEIIHKLSLISTSLRGFAARYMAHDERF
jgi:hypothetical protein